MVITLNWGKLKGNFCNGYNHDINSIIINWGGGGGMLLHLAVFQMASFQNSWNDLPQHFQRKLFGSAETKSVSFLSRKGRRQLWGMWGTEKKMLPCKHPRIHCHVLHEEVLLWRHCFAAPTEVLGGFCSPWHQQSQGLLLSHRLLPDPRWTGGLKLPVPHSDLYRGNYFIL